MKKSFLLISLIAVCCVLTQSMMAAPSAKRVKTGIEVLRDRGFDVLEGKRVGLVTNPTGVDGDLKSTIDILNEAPNVNLVALFGPEHGVRGDVYAGDVVDNVVDEKTGIMMYSLFGKTRKPTKEMMDLIDVLVYDIQDNGCRSYTFISTMGNLMEACAEFDKELVVLDRPNPLGGEKIEGNLAEIGCISFVSQFRIPYLYAQTCGELALYLNAVASDSSKGLNEGQLTKPCKLTVVPMEGWQRWMNWDDTGLEWVVSSPHVQTGHTAYFYPVTGIFGELGYFSIGVGYTLPFELFAASWINADSLAAAMNALDLPGLRFRAIHFNPYYSVGKGEHYQGVQIHIMDYKKVRLSEVQFYLVQELMRLYPEKDVFRYANDKRFNMFDKVCGTHYIRENFAKNYRWSDVSDYWYKDVDSYREASKKYYLYE